MAFNLSLNNSISSSTPKGLGGSSAVVYGRVIEVILDEDHSFYSLKGGAISINGVFYKNIVSNKKEENLERLPFAYQSQSKIKEIPLVGEIVKIESFPVPSANDFSGRSRQYYTGILNIWNSPNNNFYPDVTNNIGIDFSQNNKFKELSRVNPIASSPGDIQFEGRQGQSIRFTGGLSKSNPWVDSDNIGAPLTIISNGQIETDDGFTTIGEDVNSDASSIYLTSNHTIPLVEGNNKRDAYNEDPTKAEAYKGKQIILNSNRVFLNSKKDDIQLSSGASIGLTGRTSVNLDANSLICLDAPLVILGKKARTSPAGVREPVVLGNKLENLLESLLVQLQGLSADLGTCITVKGDAIPILNKRGAQMAPIISSLRTLINPSGQSSLKSKKVFTE